MAPETIDSTGVGAVLAVIQLTLQKKRKEGKAMGFVQGAKTTQASEGRGIDGGGCDSFCDETIT